MARQLIQKCRVCGVYTYDRKCPKCGGESHAAAPLKWTPEDPQAHRRRKMQDVSLETWDETLPTIFEEE